MVNRVILIGRVGKAPEIRYTPSGDAVANFSMAMTEKWKSDGEAKEKTTWVDIVAWKKLAEVIQEYVDKGSLLYVEGKLQKREWEAEGGGKRSKMEVLANNVRFLNTKKRDDSVGHDGPSADHFDDDPF